MDEITLFFCLPWCFVSDLRTDFGCTGGMGHWQELMPGEVTAPRGTWCRNLEILKAETSECFPANQFADL